MFRHRADEHQERCGQYLESPGESFVFDAASGIYKPKTCYEQQKGNTLKKIWKNFRKHWAGIILNALTLVFIIKYTGYARKQWCEMRATVHEVQQQTTLMREQVINAQGAVIKPHPVLNGPLKSGTQDLVFDWINEGHSYSKILLADFEIAKVDVRSSKPISNPIPIHVEMQDLAPSQSNLPPPSRTYHFPLTESEVRRMKYVELCISVKGSFIYENGFEQNYSRPLCFVYVTADLIDSKGSRFNPGGEFRTCEESTSYVPNLLDQKRDFLQRAEK